MKSISAYKKVKKARNALYKGSGLTLMTKFYLGLAILMLGIGVAATLDKSSTETDGLYSIMIVNGIWMSMFCYFFRSVLPNQITPKQRAMAKGNATVSELFVQFPVTKKDCVKVSFNEWVFTSLAPIVFGIYFCVASMVIDYLESEKGEIGFMIMTTVVSLAFVEYSSIIAVNHKKKYKNVLTMILLIFYFILIVSSVFLSKLYFMQSFYSLFKFVAGPVGIAMLILVVPIMALLTKVFVLDTSGKEAWIYEIND